MKELELNVKNIECMGCENRIKNVVKEIKIVKDVTASHETGKVNINLKRELNEDIKNMIIDSIERIGFEVER